MNTKSKIYCEICNKEIYAGNDYAVIKMTGVTHPFNHDKYFGAVSVTSYSLCTDCEDEIFPEVKSLIAKKKHRRN